jgi:hypothetical protein
MSAVVRHDLTYTANVVEEQNRSALHIIILPVSVLCSAKIHGHNLYSYGNKYAYGAVDIVVIEYIAVNFLKTDIFNESFHRYS